ncbi:MAG: dienelactone hydrolase family protein [Deltaproteobacteria bacterium]|nr:dienelactone hydrolase family protein [Deltaproteobacteria bacterium]
MPKEVERLIAEAQEGQIGRREFISQVAKLLGSVVLASVLFDSAVGGRAEGAVVAADDPDLESGWVDVPAKDYTAFFYHSKPKAGGPFPGVLVISENRGVDEHIQDVTRRFAKEGYFAAAPDTISRFGGIRELGKEAAMGMTSGMRSDIVLDVVKTTFDYLRRSKGVKADRIGIVGFCFGGGVSLLTATKIPELAACVLFYGKSPNPISQVKDIKAPVLGLYGGEDKGITSKVPELKKVMDQYGKSFEYQIYDGAKHAFHNETRSDRYHPEAARDAWMKTLAFFGKHLRKGGRRA